MKHHTKQYLKTTDCLHFVFCGIYLTAGGEDKPISTPIHRYM
jgi:hypothetical protein